MSTYKYNPLTGKLDLVGDGSSSSGGSLITTNIPVILSGGKTLGRFVNGDTIPSAGKTVEQVLIDIAQEYLTPAFTSFVISGQTLTIEAGSTLSGAKTFTWGTSNSINVSPNTVSIKDLTAVTTLATGLANDGTQSVNIGTVLFVGETAHIWQIEATNTLSAIFNRIFTVTSQYVQFYGPSNSIPSSSVTVRALPSSRFNNVGVTFQLNTGTTELNFIVALPSPKTIVSVIDLDAANANLTSSYILTGTVSVNDASGTPKLYNVYALTIAVPYSSNHRHSITTN